jgi:diacylglycerol kinase
MIKIKRLVKSFLYAFKGLIKTFKEEQNFKIHIFATIVVILFAWYLKVSKSEWMALTIVIGLVVLMEIINSAIERITDVLKPRIDSYVKEIKDITAAGVLIAAIVAIAVGLIIFLPYLFGSSVIF